MCWVTFCFGSWQISDITEVQHLSRLQHLRILTLSENPIARDASYRIKVGPTALPTLAHVSSQVLGHFGNT